MINYTEIRFEGINNNEIEILIAKLTEMGWAGMEEIENGLIAYADETLVDMEELLAFTNTLGINFKKSNIEERNWNALWESNFDPVIIPDKIHVRAHFHPQLGGFEHEILITPKMSFGTGHHATTRMMMKAMLDIDFNNKSVIDFGTGTGILAILAEKLKAKNIEAIDNDSWSFTNVQENIAANACKNISIQLGTNLDSLGKADILLANINKSVLLDHALAIRNHLNDNGKLLLSGLLKADYDDIMKKYSPIFGDTKAVLHDNGWIAMIF
jgi:ribosomal protein L11 methyltransferase